jgi:hypothetical protein
MSNVILSQKPVWKENIDFPIYSPFNSKVQMLTRSLRVFARRSALVPGPTVFSSTHAIPRADEADQFPLRERQESLLIENLDKAIGSPEDLSKLTGIESDKILLMKTKLGQFTGRALLLVGPDEVLKAPLPFNATARPLDITDTQLFVEQCERFVKFTEDIRRLATEAGNDGFNRIVTISGLPKSYSRADVGSIMSEATKNAVYIPKLSNIVFRFKKNGYQSDTCFVLLDSAEDALQVLKAVQEYPVPQRRVYGTSFGCSFISADRSSLFLKNEKLDYVLDGKYWLMTLGWNAELDEQQMQDVLHKLAIYPNKIVSVGDGNFLLRFERMKNTKLVFSRLNRLKRRWRIPANISFFAYPVRADLHFAGDEMHADEAQDCDSDLDEPVMY